MYETIMRHSAWVLCMRQSWDIQPESHVWDNHETFSLSLMYETIMRHSAWVSCMRQSWDIQPESHIWDSHETFTTRLMYETITRHPPQVSQELLVLLVAHSISHILTSVHVFLCVGACMSMYVCAHARVCIHTYAQRYKPDYAKFDCDSILNIDDMKRPMYPTTAQRYMWHWPFFVFGLFFLGVGVGGDFFFVLYFVHCHPWQLVNMWWVSI